MQKDNPEKILIATGIFPPDMGGPASYVPKIANELIADGREVVVLTYSDSINDDDYAYKVARVARGKSRMLRYLKYLFYVLLLGKNCDVIYCQCPFASGLPSVIANIALRKKLIIKVVGDAAWETSVNKKITTQNIDDFVLSRGDKKPYTKLLFYLQSFVLRRFDTIIVPSFYLKNIVKTYTGKKPVPIKVINNSFDVIDFNVIDREREKAKLGLSNKKVVLSVSRLVDWKNTDVLIRSVGFLKEDCVLCVAGDGPNLEKYKKLTKKLNMENKVLFLGKLPKRRLYEVYQMSDCFVLISDYEGQSHTLLEAMYMGLPVVVSDKGGNPETVKDYAKAIVLEDYKNPKTLAVELEKSLNTEKGAIRDEWVRERFSYKKMLSETLQVI